MRADLCAASAGEIRIGEMAAMHDVNVRAVRISPRHRQTSARQSHHRRIIPPCHFSLIVNISCIEVITCEPVCGMLLRALTSVIG